MQAVNQEHTSKAFRTFRGQGIEPILIKGWAISRFYPRSNSRISTDVDLCIPPDDFDCARELWSSTSANLSRIDLHRGLEDRDLLEWSELFDRSYLVDLNGTAVRVLSDEDHLRIVCAHWLIDGGVYKDKLWDIYYLVSNRKLDFDWDRCLNAAGRNRKTWVLAALATARDHLQLDTSGLSDEIRNFQLPEWYNSTLEKEWRLGPYPRIRIWLALNRPKTLLTQIRRRFPPNPIAATTDTEGPIDETPRLRYQLKSISKKLRPAAKGFVRRLYSSK
jgi:hypothetical protein